MTRATVLSGVVMTALIAAIIAGLQQASGGAQRSPDKVIEVQTIKDNLYLLKGGGGNTAVFVTDAGVTVVDTKNPGWGQPLLDTIRGITNKKVTRIINTPAHYDHVSGNVEFAPDVEVIAQENTKTAMQQMRSITGLSDIPAGNIFKDHNGRGLPTRTFGQRMSVGVGSNAIELYYFGRGHTGGDAWVVFPTLRVMHAGDAFARKSAPILDANNGGSGIELPMTLSKAASTVRNVDVIITGHSSLMTMDDLRNYALFNQEVFEAIQAGRRSGRTVEEVSTRWKVPERFISMGYTAPQPELVKSNVQVIYDELEKRESSKGLR